MLLVSVHGSLLSVFCLHSRLNLPTFAYIMLKETGIVLILHKFFFSFCVNTFICTDEIASFLRLKILG